MLPVQPSAAMRAATCRLMCRLPSRRMGRRTWLPETTPTQGTSCVHGELVQQQLQHEHCHCYYHHHRRFCCGWLVQSWWHAVVVGLWRTMQCSLP